MTVIDFNAQVGSSSADVAARPTIGVWRDRIVGSVRDLAAMVRRRRALRRLAEFDDRMLDDIGVTRAELNWALHLPLRANAALELESEARARRRHERGH